MKRGFSMVEMMVAVGLVALLASIGFANMLRSNEQKRVTEAAETIRQTYTQAKAFALAGRKDCTACGGAGGVCGKGDADLTAWHARIYTGPPPTYEIYGNCGGTLFFRPGQKGFSDRVRVSTSGGSSNVRFKPLNGGTTLNNTLTVTVSSTLNNIRSKRFTVSIEGEISAITTP